MAPLPNKDKADGGSLVVIGDHHLQNSGSTAKTMGDEELPAAVNQLQPSSLKELATHKLAKIAYVAQNSQDLQQSKLLLEDTPHESY